MTTDEDMRKPNDHDWKCSGCGVVTPDRKRVCGCITACVYRRISGEMQSRWKFGEGEGEAHIHEREQAAYERGKADGIKEAKADRLGEQTKLTERRVVKALTTNNTNLPRRYWAADPIGWHPDRRRAPEKADNE